MSKHLTSHPPSRRSFFATVFTLAWAFALPLRAETPPLRLATSTPGGGFAAYGQMLERVLNRRTGYPLLQAVPTKGTGENLELLAQGRVDAALIQGTAASEVLARPDAGGLRILFAMYPSPGMLAVPAGSPLRQLDDARGRKVVLGVRTSGLVTLGRQVFEGIGPSPTQIVRIRERYPLLQAMTMPPGTYPGMTEPLPTVGSVNLILARPGLDDARAKAFVQAMDAAAAKLSEALPQAAFSTLANTLAGAPDPALLHPVLRADR